LKLIAELRRRNVFRVGIAYGIATWALLQITDVISPILDLPEWAPKLFFVILAIGFIPALIFAWAFELTPEGIKKEKDVDRTESITNVTGRKLDFVIIGVLFLAVAMLLFDRYAGQAGEPEQRQVEKSIAVLPFVNMSSDAEQDFFSDGITEEILNALAAVKELKVAGRTSSFAFKGKDDDLRRIGDTLGVEHILEGSVRKSGTKIRITAQLIQVEDGFHLWSDTYDRELTDVFAIQDEIANEILKQLKTQLLGEQALVHQAQRTDPEVYDLYLLAKQRLYTRSRQSIESAVELLDKAIALDPAYAPPYAQRGIATMLLTDENYGVIPKEDGLKQGKRFVDLALKLDTELAEAWAGLGLYYSQQASEQEAAIDALTKALALNPNLINASNWLYNALTSTGDVASSLQLVEDMTERDPLYRPGFGNAVVTYLNFGMENKVQALIDRLRSFDPTNTQLLRAEAMQYFYRGDAAEGMNLAEQAYELAPTDSVYHFTYSIGLAFTLQLEKLAEDGTGNFQINALDALGRREEAYDIAYESARDGYPGSLLRLFNRSGRSEDAVDYLEERWPNLDSFAADNPYGEFGYSVMNEVALAYFNTGNTERFDDALMRVENSHAYLSEQGIDNWVLILDEARYLALAGQNEDAVARLEAAFERGMYSVTPIATAMPVFALLGDNPRLAALEAAMNDKMNAERETLDLPPRDPRTEFWQYPETSL
jgi:TolB-like protein/Tfp pilus assembly protein PilF